MITTFPTTPLGADDPAILAIPGPKHIWVDGARITVASAEDIPPPPPPAVEYVEKATAIKALRDAGVKDDATADAALKTAESGIVAAPIKAIG